MYFIPYVSVPYGKEEHEISIWRRYSCREIRIVSRNIDVVEIYGIFFKVGLARDGLELALPNALENYRAGEITWEPGCRKIEENALGCPGIGKMRKNENERFVLTYAYAYTFFAFSRFQGTLAHFPGFSGTPVPMLFFPLYNSLEHLEAPPPTHSELDPF